MYTAVNIEAKKSLSVPMYLKATKMFRAWGYLIPVDEDGELFHVLFHVFYHLKEYIEFPLDEFLKRLDGLKFGAWRLLNHF